MLSVRQVLPVILYGCGILSLHAQSPDLQKSIETVHAIGAEGEGHVAAQAAIRSLEAAPIEGLGIILSGIRDDKPLSRNWLRSAAASIVDRNKEVTGKVPAEMLAAFVADLKNPPGGRFAAFELLERADNDRAKRLVPAMLNDRSLDLRRIAVAAAMDDAEALLKSDEKSGAEKLRTILSSARDVDQIESISEQLTELKQSVDLIRHFGFLTSWKLVGPFDHEGSKQFDTVYPPEKELPPNFTKEYDGKDGKITWIDYTTDDTYGTVDLNKALDNHKGAIAYAATKFIAKSPAEIEIRMGCINGNKIWLNGNLLTANEVYHSNIAIDQYVGRGKLKVGENWILVKVAQNEQTEGWAQRWQFQLRVCDALGTSFLPVASK